MDDKRFDPDLHRRRSIRLRNYDYAQEGLYFVTLCARNRECIFGKIMDDEVRLNETGEIVQNEWVKTSEIRKEIEIHRFVIMPNHFHSIIEIVNVGAYGIRPNDTGPNKGVCHTPLRSPSKTVGALMRGFKSSVTKRLGYSPWQRNYYEHIIRNTDDCARIDEYIAGNPSRWEVDCFYM